MSSRRRVHLLDGFELWCGEGPVQLPRSGQRLVAFLALHDRALTRSQVAGSLWPDTTEERAGACLRSALWRLRRPGHDVVEATTSHLQLLPEVWVDVREMVALAHRLVDHSSTGDELDLELLSLGELLPGWDEDWVVIERERIRQLRLHALEAMCEALAAEGWFGLAVEAGLTAVADEPLRESTHRALIEAYLAEGNRYDAIRHYHRYRQLLQEELGLEPAPQIQRLVSELSFRVRSPVVLSPR